MVKVIGKRVVVKPIDTETKTTSGIYIPDTAIEKPNVGNVIHVGETEVLSVGDKVIFPKGCGTSIKIDEEECLIMFESDIYAVI